MLPHRRSRSTEAEMQTTHHTGGDQEGTRSHVTAGVTHTGQGTLEALMGLIEETVAVHLQLQVRTEELHGHTELSRACRGMLRDLYRLGPRTGPKLARGRAVSRQNGLIPVNRPDTRWGGGSMRHTGQKRFLLGRLPPPGKTA